MSEQSQDPAPGTKTGEASAGGGPEPRDLETPPRRRSFGERLVAALRLDTSVFEEVEHDPSALGQAVGVVALGAVASGLGVPGVGMTGVLGGIVFAVVGWLLGAGLIWLIGVKGMNATSDYPELLRTLGFASAPYILLVLGILPLGPFLFPLSLVVFVWVLIAYVMAVRAALDVQIGAAVGVCLAAVAIRLVLAGLITGISGL
jgi:hypothetical protein